MIFSTCVRMRLPSLSCFLTCVDCAKESDFFGCDAERMPDRWKWLINCDEWKKLNTLIIHPSTVFSAWNDWDHLAKIRQHDWKTKISKVAKFENDLLKTKEDITPQSRKILQMFVWWGASSCPPVTNVCKISRLCRAISSLSLDVSPLNLVIYNFKLLFPAVFDGYSLTALHQKLEKKVNHENVYWPYQARTRRTRTCMSVEIIF